MTSNADFTAECQRDLADEIAQRKLSVRECWKCMHALGPFKVIAGRDYCMLCLAQMRREYDELEQEARDD